MYRSLADAAFCEIKVFFASAAGLKRQWDPNFAREVSWEGISLKFPHTFLNRGAVLPLSAPIDAPDLGAALGEYDPEVLVVYGYSQRLQRRALRWGIGNKRFILMISDSENRRRQAGWKKALKRAMLPQIYKKLDGFLTVGDANEDHYQDFGVRADRLFRAPFPIDRNLFDAAFSQRAALARACRGDLGIPSENVVCVIVGKLVPWKRQGDLVAALRLLENAECELTAVIVGSGEDLLGLQSASRTLRRHTVLFPGFVQPGDLPKYYAAADIYVHASSKEPHSLAITEAVYMGCPVVLSDRCGSYGPCDDVQPGRNGFVYRCGDARALADCIGRLAAHRETRESFGSASLLIGRQFQALAHGGGLQAALTALRLR